ncbi:MAG: peptidoglycan DD-metalloendopeptidase family protein, partial [Candidatus Roizmanbacteria bacterium]|nr:peptidoglycan DD-metalloendopeptidase family protein [Candidatus Roizmanbacteria bacterium]
MIAVGGITVQVHVLERVQIVSVTDIATQTPPTLPNQQQPTAQNPIQPTHLLPEVVVKTNGVLVRVVLKVAELIINPLVLAEVAVVIPMIVPMVQLNFLIDLIDLNNFQKNPTYSLCENICHWIEYSLFFDYSGIEMRAKRLGIFIIFVLVLVFFSQSPVIASGKTVRIESYPITLEQEFYGDLHLKTVYFHKSIGIDYKSGKVVLSGNPDGTGDIDVGEELRITSLSSTTSFVYRSCPHKRMPPLDITHMMWTGHYERITSLTFAYISRYCPNSVKKDGRAVAYSSISPMYVVHFNDYDPDAAKPFLMFPWLGSKNVIPYFVDSLDIKYDDKGLFFGDDKEDIGRYMGIKYGAPVIAAAGGNATYVGDCLSCGHSIYINHGNGYQTRYYHLQKDGLISNRPFRIKTVKQGTPIGKVNYVDQKPGLYFVVVHDDNGDGNFDDDYPTGVIDPFGRLSGDYLWQIPKVIKNRQTIHVTGSDISFYSGVVRIPKNFFKTDKMITIKPILPPKTGSVQGLGLGAKITIDDGFGNLLEKFDKTIQIAFSTFYLNISGYRQDSFGVYSSKDGSAWQKEETIIDQKKNEAVIFVDHLSYFALMGEQLDNLAPVTSAMVTDGFLSLQTADLPLRDSSGVDDTLYRINNAQWLEYADPVYIEPGQSYLIEYFSVDKNGNKENVKSLKLNLYPYKSPLIFIPGMGGSELKTTSNVSWLQPDGHGGTFYNIYTFGEKVWVNNLQAILPGNDDYFDILRLKTDGQTGEADLALTGNVLDVYQETIDLLTSADYVLGRDLFVFPYDWRKDIRATADLLDQKIESVKQQTKSKKVDILAHSMGGLVARNYLIEPKNAIKVSKLITLGTPHLGAVEMIKNLRYGGCLTNTEILNFLAENNICFGLARSEVSDLLQNMASGYAVIPSQKYYDFYNGADSDHPLPFIDNRDIDSDGVTGQLDYLQLKTMLTNLQHNTSLFSQAEAFHQSDDFLENPNGVDMTIIAGSGLPTLGQIIEDYAFDFAGIKIPKTDMRYINGDNTVPLYSASLKDGDRSLAGSAKIYYTKQKHGGLFVAGSAMNLVKNLLTGEGTLPTGVSNEPFKFSGTGLSVHSPVNIHVYDASGNHTGLTENGDFEANIPGSSYDSLDEAKFIFLPAEGVYTVKLVATGEGNFDFKIRKFADDVNTQTVLYRDVPLTTHTLAQATLDTNSTGQPVLALDIDGNG